MMENKAIYSVPGNPGVYRSGERNRLLVHDYLVEYSGRNGGVSPSVRDIAAATGLSVAGVRLVLIGLEKQGKIRRMPGQHRSIQLLTG